MNEIGYSVEELTVELAERLTGTKESVNFSNVTSLDPEVAAFLSKHPGNLAFPAINKLTPEVAKALVSESKNVWLVLDGLKELSPEIARELAVAKCALRLGIDKVTPEVAEILATHQSTLSLGLKSISPEIAEKLAMHKSRLQLDLLTTLDAESAAKLAKHGGSLSLLRLEAMTPDVAEAMGRFDGDSLELNGLETLEFDIAKRLADAKCSGGFYLNGLTEVSPDVIEVLANGNSNLSLQGLEFIDSSSEQAILDAEKKLGAMNKTLLRREQIQPWLKLDSHHQTGSIDKGETFSLLWKLRGYSVGSIEVQALHIKEGKIYVVSEGVIPVDSPKSIEVELQLKSLDETLPAKGKVLVPSLSIDLDGIATKSMEGEKFTWLGNFHIYSVSMSGKSESNSKYILLKSSTVTEAVMTVAMAIRSSL